MMFVGPDKNIPKAFLAACIAYRRNDPNFLAGLQVCLPAKILPDERTAQPASPQPHRSAEKHRLFKQISCAFFGQRLCFTGKCEVIPGSADHAVCTQLHLARRGVRMNQLDTGLRSEGSFQAGDVGFDTFGMLFTQGFAGITADGAAAANRFDS